MTDNINGSNRKRFAKRRNFVLAIIGASSIVALIIYSSIALQQVDAEDTLGKVLITKTRTSIQDPGAGHESHQIVMFLPPLGEDVIYSGTLA